MMKRLSPGGRIDRVFRLGLALLPLVALACEGGNRPVPADSSSEVRRLVTMPRGRRPPQRDLRASPLLVTARISKVKTTWDDGQQLFTLTLTNTGDQPETVHAIVYATNEQTAPPRRAISPPTAYQWFELAKSSDGQLTAQDIQKNWRSNVFVTARGGKLPFSWRADLKPGESESIDAAHNLDERSPHPAAKGKKLARVGFLEYRIWLFTTDGQCFDEQTVPAKSPSKERLSPKGELDPPAKNKAVTKKGPPSTPASKAEEQAAAALRLAKYYLDNNKPEKARAKLQLILDKYPQSAAAAEAKKLLAKLPDG